MAHKETPAARQAFEDWYDLGSQRTCTELARQYRRIAYEAGEADENGKRIPGVRVRSVPTLSPDRIHIWSREHKWRLRCQQRISERAEQFRRRSEESSIAVREHLASSLELQLLAAAKELDDRLGEGSGLALAEGTAGLRRVVDLFMALIGEPLAEHVVAQQTVRHEPTAGGLLDEVLADPEARDAAVQLAHSLAKARARRKEVTEEPEEEPLGSGGNGADEG